MMSNAPVWQQMYKGLIVALLCVGTYGCSSVNQYDELTAQEIKLPPVSATPIEEQASIAHKPKLAIAFGGGAARGLVHLGVIKALEEAGIKADIVTGTSIGSIAAALYSSNEYADIERKIFEFNEHDIIDINFSGAGLLKGKALAEWVNKQTGYDDIQELPITTGIVATNLTQHKAVVFTAGDIGQAVQTSSSVPGAFVPIYHHGDILVDGGVLSLVPVYAARQLGADIVIGIDVFCSIPPPLDYSAIDAMANTFWLQSCIIAKDELHSADIVLVPTAPDPSVVNFGDEETRRKAQQVGYEAMQAQLPDLKLKLNRSH